MVSIDPELVAYVAGAPLRKPAVPIGDPDARALAAQVVSGHKKAAEVASDETIDVVLGALASSTGGSMMKIVTVVRLDMGDVAG